MQLTLPGSIEAVRGAPEERRLAREVVVAKRRSLGVVMRTLTDRRKRRWMRGVNIDRVHMLRRVPALRPQMPRDYFDQE